jgi:hypothetical protein
LFELIEGARSLVNAAGSIQSDPVYAAPPLLESLTFASPVAADLKLAHEAYELIRHMGIYSYLSMVIAAVVARKHWYEGSAKKAEAELSKEKLRKKQISDKSVRQNPNVDQTQSAIESESTAQDVLAAEKALGTAAAGLESDGLAAIRELLPNSSMTDDDVRRHIRRHIVPVLTALAESGITEIELPDEDRSAS